MELLASVTTKGQVTIPVQVRRLLGVAAHDKVAFVVEDCTVRLQRRGSIVARTAGAFRTDEPPLSAEQLRVVAEEVIAEEAVRRAR